MVAGLVRGFWMPHVTPGLVDFFAFVGLFLGLFLGPIMGLFLGAFLGLLLGPFLGLLNRTFDGVEFGLDDSILDGRYVSLCDEKGSCSTLT